MKKNRRVGSTVELFIVHPSMTPANISEALGLDAHRVGDQRRTPGGTLLPGQYPDTRWRHCIRYEARNQWFADKVAILVDRLMLHKEFLHRVRATGGEATVIVQFLGDGYFGDNLRLDTLSKMSELQLNFGIECCVEPQSRSRDS